MDRPVSVLTVVGVPWKKVLLRHRVLNRRQMRKRCLWSSRAKDSRAIRRQPSSTIAVNDPFKAVLSFKDPSGESGFQKEQCEAKGCCWAERKDGKPQCFFKNAGFQYCAEQLYRSPCGKCSGYNVLRM